MQYIKGGINKIKIRLWNVLKLATMNIFLSITQILKYNMMILVVKSTINTFGILLTFGQ